MSCTEKTELPDFNTHWNYNDPQSTNTAFMNIKIKIDNRELPYEKDYYAKLLTQIARTQELQRKFSEAHEILDSADSLIIPQEHPVAWICYLLERGRVYNSSGKKDKALPYFLDAWKWGNDNKQDIYAIDAAHMLGIATKPEAQLDWNLKALELTERTLDKKAKGWLGPLYNNIGWTYHDQGDYEKALDMFQKGLNWREQVGDTLGAMIARWTVGRTYRSLRDFDKALAIQLNQEREIDEQGLDKDGYVYEELAELYLEKEDRKRAADYFRLAYDLLSTDPWLQANEPERLARLKKLGE